MLKFAISMLIPLWIAIYTVSFGRWMHRRGSDFGAFAAVLLSVLSFCASGAALWRMLM